jgi:uncharacterized membrane protein YjjP (DUF1212 family)
MGKTSRRKSDSGRRQAKALRKENALLPFHLFFGAAWVIFGFVALGYGFHTREQGALAVGGLVTVLGGVLLIRAVMAWRRVQAGRRT